MRKLWTIWFAVAALSGTMAACGSEETGSVTASGQPDTGSNVFEPDTGDQADTGGQQNADTGADAGTPSRQSDASAPADGGAQTDGQNADAEQPTQGDDAGDTGQPAQDGGNGQTDTDSGASQVPANADVVKVSGACQMRFSALYASGAVNGELRGSIPDVMTWDSGPTVTDGDADGYLEYSPASLPSGTFDLSYLGNGNWALYGTEAQLLTMSAAARAFVSCNWFDGTDIIAVANPECHLRIKVEDGCLISGAGNMANLQ
jgi:hypothetical protein